MEEILDLIQEWAGSRQQALYWYSTHQISALGNLTPKELVNQGRMEELKAYIQHIDLGGYS